MKKFNSAQKDIILYLYKHNAFSIPIIAQVFNCTRQTIYQLIKRIIYNTHNNLSVNENDSICNTDNQIDVNEISSSSLPDKHISETINEVSNNINRINNNDIIRVSKFLQYYYKHKQNDNNNDIEEIKSDYELEAQQLLNNIPIYLEIDIDIIKYIFKQLIDNKYNLDQFNILYLQYILNKYNSTENLLKLQYVFNNNTKYYKYFQLLPKQLNTILLRENLVLDIDIIKNVLDDLMRKNKKIESFNNWYIKRFISQSILKK